MVTNKEEQLHRYFEHVMSPVEEQSFLITVAASDEMRIAFRSQLELMKAVRSDKDSLRSVAQVRSRTLTALGLSATAVTPFIEHELLRGAKNQDAPQHQSASFVSNALPLQSGWIGRLSSVIRQPILALTGGLALGVITTTAVMRQIETNDNIPTATQSAPQLSTGQMKGEATETIPAVNGLNNSSRSVQQASRHAGEGDRAVAQKSSRILAPSASLLNDHPRMNDHPRTIPEMNRSAAAKMQSHKATIIKPDDSAK